MLTREKSLEERALALPTEDRERLANNLLQSLASEPLSDVDAAWLELAEERFQALQDGRDSGMSENEFFASLK